VPHRLLGRRQHAGGEHRRIRGGTEERRAAHGPGLQQALLLGDHVVHPSLPHISDSGMQGEQRRPRRAVLDTTPARRDEQPVLAQPRCEVVGCQAERDDVFLRNAPGHAPTLPQCRFDCGMQLIRTRRDIRTEKPSEYRNANHHRSRIQDSQPTAGKRITPRNRRTVLGSSGSPRPANDRPGCSRRVILSP
jgi:hypothetical protein